MQILEYTSNDEKRWNAFIRESKNGTFLFHRGYMEYHADRFTDASLLVLSEKGAVIAVLPANRVDDVVYSHQGLTFGGLIINNQMK